MEMPTNDEPVIVLHKTLGVAAANLIRRRRARPGFPYVFLTHVFRVENPDVLSESLSFGRRPLTWLERPRINGTYSEPFPLTAFQQMGRSLVQTEVRKK